MKKFRLLLLDANVVIKLFSIGLWEAVIDKCDVHLAGTVVNESAHWEDEFELHPINLTPFIENGKITVHDIDASKIQIFMNQFKPKFLERLDPGESESLAILCDSPENYLICSADAIVYRVLGALMQSDQGISLEEIMTSLGEQHQLDYQFTKKFKDECCKQGFSESFTGQALKSQ